MTLNIYKRKHLMCMRQVVEPTTSSSPSPIQEPTMFRELIQTHEATRKSLVFSLFYICAPQRHRRHREWTECNCKCKSIFPTDAPPVFSFCALVSWWWSLSCAACTWQARAASVCALVHHRRSFIVAIIPMCVRSLFSLSRYTIWFRSFAVTDVDDVVPSVVDAPVEWGWTMGLYAGHTFSCV